MITTFIIATLTAPTLDMKALLTEGLKEEYMAHATYAAINVKFGNKRPFSNIVRAEEKHKQVFIKLFEARKFEIPKDTYVQGKSESTDDYNKRLNIPETWKGALELGLKIENEDVKFLGDALKSPDLPQDVKASFEQLLKVSRDNHADAFKRSLGISK